VIKCNRALAASCQLSERLMAMRIYVNKTLKLTCGVCLPYGVSADKTSF
jgi:hypothetical protein